MPYVLVVTFIRVFSYQKPVVKLGMAYICV
jgi:hypothetical protein